MQKIRPSLTSWNRSWHHLVDGVGLLTTQQQQQQQRHTARAREKLEQEQKEKQEIAKAPPEPCSQLMSLVWSMQISAPDLMDAKACGEVI